MYAGLAVNIIAGVLNIRVFCINTKKEDIFLVDCNKNSEKEDKTKSIELGKKETPNTT